jgi:hypothetical protein
MKWRKLSDKFPDDWESKILRTVGTNIALINVEWEHINATFWNPIMRICFGYDDIEWLDKSEEDKDELWEELEGLAMDHIFSDEEVGPYGFGDFIKSAKEKYIISRK